MLGYQYTLEYRSTSKHSNADCLSRLPRGVPISGAESDQEAVIKKVPLNTKQLTKATLADPCLSRVIRYCRDGWPVEVSAELQPYFQKQDEPGPFPGFLWGGSFCKNMDSYG